MLLYHKKSCSQKALLFFVFLLTLFFSNTSDVFAIQKEALRSSVVKIFANKTAPDFTRPWQMQEDQASVGSGSIIAGNRILTNAHIVAHSTFIEVKKASDPKKYTARVIAVGHDCDLALLEVEDPEFFMGTKPIEIGELPFLRDTVTVIGFPRGGNQISITEGVVSRIDVTTYAHSGRALLSVQIDAAINPGNSGGPVIQDERLIGVAFQGLMESENIGYIIPTPIVKHFLADLEDGHYDGFPMLGIVTSRTENQAIRDYYKLTDFDGGLLVSEIVAISKAKKKLKEGDVILEMDGYPIASDRTIEFRPDERILFTYLINKKQVDDTIDLVVVRKGKRIEMSAQLTHYHSLVPPPYFYETPEYYITGGLVFSILSQDLLMQWNPEWGARALTNLNYFTNGLGKFDFDERDEICLLLFVLPDDVNKGYHHLRLEIVESVNDKKIKSFDHLIEELEKKQKFTRIITAQKAEIILDQSLLEEGNPRIQSKYRLPSLQS